MAEHLRHIEVERFYAVALFEGEMRVARRFADHVERCPFAFSNLAHVVDVLLVDEQAHSFLTFVGDDFLRRERLIADGQFRHIDFAAAVLNQFRQAIQMACRTVVVNRNDGILVFLDQRTHEVVGAFLHFGIGTLNRVQFDAVGIASRIDRRHRAAAESDAIVVATHDHHFIALLRLFFQAVALLSVAHAACQHNDFVVGIGDVFLMLKRQHRPANQRLTELVSEVRCAIRRFDENLFGRLIEPFALCVAGCRHINGCSCNRPRACATAHSVADFAARACRRPVERLDCCREIMRLGFQRNHALDVLHLKPVGGRLIRRCKLLDHRPLRERHIIFIGREYLVRMLCRCLFNHLEERRFLFLAVDDEGAAENLVSAMFRIDLREAENL